MEKINTPLTELIEKLRNQQKFNPKESDYDKGLFNGIAAAIDLAKRLLPNEKQAIMDAVNHETETMCRIVNTMQGIELLTPNPQAGETNI